MPPPGTPLLLTIAAIPCVISSNAVAAERRLLSNTGASEPQLAYTQALADLTREIALLEYHMAPQECAPPAAHAVMFTAPNRAQNLRVSFTLDGVRVTPCMMSSGSDGSVPLWEWGLTFVSCGRVGRTRPLEVPRLTGLRNRVEYHRRNLIEWYVNKPEGLEHGFFVLSPMHGDDGATKLLNRVGRHPSDQRLCITMRTSGTLLGRIAGDGGGVQFIQSDGATALSYGKLRVTDATGRALPSEIALKGEQLSILVDDTGAVYPITIDPLATNPNWSSAGAQIGAALGSAVATAGDVNGDGYNDVIIGAPYFDHGEADEGRVFLHYGSASGLSTTADWTGEGNQVDALFGYSVAAAGDVNGDGYDDVLVGAPGYDNGEENEGRVFVYYGSVTGLGAVAEWTAESNHDSSSFGQTVALAGDVNGDGFGDVLVGAPDWENGQSGEGAVFAYYGSPTGPGLTADWIAEGDLEFAEFGKSVACAGDVDGDGFDDVIVGAPYYSDGETFDGRALVYMGSASGLSATPNWSVGSSQDGSRFGDSVAMAGDVNGDGFSDVIVGAPLFDSGQLDEGCAFVYLGSPSGLGGSPTWTRDGNNAGGEFGYAVATAGDVNGDGFSDVIVGAPKHTGDQFHQGRCRVYLGSATGLKTTVAWTVRGEQRGALYGQSVAAAGDINRDGFTDLIVGSPGWDGNEAGEGSVRVYYGGSWGPSTAADWTAEVEQPAGYFGTAVAGAGDVNGDGFSDIAVGAPGWHSNDGAAFVYHGSQSGLSGTPDWSVESIPGAAQLGLSLDSAGDVNGDGYDDFIVGARWYSNGQSKEGAAWVFHGSPAGLDDVASWTVESNQGHAWLGNSVAAAGDVNGDGYGDVIVGAPLYNENEEDEGLAVAYYGSATGLSSTPNWSAKGEQADAQFGISVRGTGDVNGDGYADVIVGSPAWDGDLSGEGRACVYYGSPVGLRMEPGWIAEGNQAGALFGSSVGPAGDVNGDGFADVIVGATNYDDPQSAEGRALVFYGSSEGLEAEPAWTASGDDYAAHMGDSVFTAGDVNGDGYADVIVGAPQYGAYAGAAFVYYGSLSGLSPDPDWTGAPGQNDVFFGSAVGTAPDVNGDGYSDIIVGAPHFEDPQADEGRAFLYFGNASGGLSIRPQQRRTDDIAPIARFGRSDDLGGFALKGLVRTPYGRQAAKFEWEIKPMGTPFDGTGTQELPVYVDTGTGGVELTDTVSGLLCRTLYHWRVRILYDLHTLPLQPSSRWLTVPYGGWDLASVRTDGVSGDVDCDADVGLAEFQAFPDCLTGPWIPALGHDCVAFDFEPDGDIDMADFAMFQAVFTGD